MFLFKRIQAVLLLGVMFSGLAFSPTVALAKKKKGKKAKSHQVDSQETGESAPTPPPPPTVDAEDDIAAAPEQDNSGGSASVEESYGASSSGKFNTTPYAQRHIVINKGMLRGDAGPADFAFLMEMRGLAIERPAGVGLGGAGGVGGTDVGVFTGIGAAFGVTDKFEAGAVVFPWYYSPSFEYADIPVYGRYQFLEGDIEIAGQLTMYLPFHSVFGIAAAVPVLWHINEKMRIDTGAQLRLNTGNGATGVGMTLPVAFNVNITPEIFVGGRSGLTFSDLGGAGLNGIPLGAQFGINVAKGLLDVTAYFQFPFLVAFNGVNTLNGDVFQIGGGATVWYQLL